MRKIAYGSIVAFGSLALAGMAAAAPPQPAGTVDYALAFPNAVHHEADITATFHGVPPGPLEIRMARSSPGRYAMHEFAKNVYSVSASDGAGHPLTIRRTDPYSWTVLGHDGTVRFHYTLFADHGDGTYSQVNGAHEHLNIPATLAFAPALADRPVSVTIKPSDPSWTVATQLIPDPGGTWHARDLQYLMDSPIEVAPLRERRWSIAEPGASYVVRLMVHSPDSNADVDKFAQMAERVYRAQVAMWGDVPNYDSGTYTFLSDDEPYASFDGMEHRNSTYIPSSQPLSEDMGEHVQALSHELFHSWNMERLRAREIEPFDFTRANPSPTLWFGEGFTNYYGPLLARRAGVTSIDQYLDDLGQSLSYVLNWTGRRYGSPEEMSLRAPFVDAATSIDPANRAIFTSYYPYGAAIALALDLQLRERAQGKTLDDMMRLLWRTHGAPEKPYVTADLREAVAQVSGDRVYADQFFQRSIEGSALPDFAPLLAQAGLTIQPAGPKKAYLGAVGAAEKDGALKFVGYPEPGSPLYEAGIGAGDQLLTIAGKPVTTLAAWNAAVKTMKPGSPVMFGVKSLGRKESITVTPVADPAFKVVRDETVGKTPTAAQLAFRTAWLGADGSMLPAKDKKAK